MVAIVSGNGLGLSGNTLGAAGQSGVGQSGDQAYVNTATGNLVLQRQDEMLLGVGPDIDVVRTYNSQGAFNDDNGDNWRLSFARQLYKLTGTVNTAGSTITRIADDGAEQIYTYSASGNYINTEGADSYNSLHYTTASATWTWTEGASGNTETYDWIGGAGKLLNSVDADGNATFYKYSQSNRLIQVNSGNNYVYLDYSGDNITQIRTSVFTGTVWKNNTRTTYEYDLNNRLTAVTVDLTPDNTTDTSTYTTHYTYDGDSKRIASITQSDGTTTLSFTYEQAASGQYRVKTYTDGLNHTTTLNYPAETDSNTSLSPSAIAGTYSTTGSSTSYNLSLSTGVQADSTPSSLNTSSSGVTTTAAGWTSATQLESLDTASASDPQTAYDSNGNGMAAWTLGPDLYVSVFNQTSNSWSVPATILDGSLAGSPSNPQLSMSNNGNALITWTQNGNVYAQRYAASSHSWVGGSAPLLISGGTLTASNAYGAINDSGQALVAFVQSDGTRSNLMTISFDGTSWQSASNLDDRGTVNDNTLAPAMVPTVALDASDNAVVMWQQKANSADAGDSLFAARYTASTHTWSNPSALQSGSTVAVVGSKIAFDGNGDGNGIAIWLQGKTLYARSFTQSAGWSSTTKTLSTNASVMPRLSMSDNGNAIVVWREGKQVKAWRYVGGAFVGTAAEAITALGVGDNFHPVGAINDAGQAIISFVNTAPSTQLYVSQFTPGTGTSGTWQTPQLVNVGTGNLISSTMQPSVAIDAAGNANVWWLQQSAGQVNQSVFTERYNASASYQYTVGSGDTWISIATALYGSAEVAAPLKAALGNPTLSTGLVLKGLPKALNGLYYTVQSGDTWASIAQALYGSTNVASALQTALGYGAVPAAGTHLGSSTLGLPVSLLYTGTVPAYYTVKSGDTWQSITQTVYGTSDPAAVAALKAALNITDPNVLPTAYATLAVIPPNLLYTQHQVLTTTTTVTDALGNITTYVSDGKGQLTDVYAPTVGGVSQHTHYDYNGKGDLISQTDARGDTTIYQYDDNGNLILQRDAAGNTVTRTWDVATNRLLTETTYLVPDTDGAGSATAGQPQTTQYVYDIKNGKLDHLRFVISAAGRVTEYRYNTVGQQTSAIQYAGSNLFTATGTQTEAAMTAWTAGKMAGSLRTDYTYALYDGALISSVQYANVNATTGAGLLDGGQATTQYVYDQFGHLLQTIAPKGVATTSNTTDFITSYTYDGLGRLLTTTDSLHNSTVTQYNDAGKSVTTLLANGLSSTSVYDSAGELISVTQYDGSTALGATNYWYDADGRLRMTQDPTGVKTYVMYDADGRKIADIQADGSTTEYTYNGDNQLVLTRRYATAMNVTTLVDGSGNPSNVSFDTVRPTADNSQDLMVGYVYDMAGRLSKTIDYVDGSLGDMTENIYDGAGRLTATVRHSYEVDDLVTAISLPTDDEIDPPYGDPDARTTRYFYDADGKLTGTLDADGYLTETQYDATGRATHSIDYATQTNSAYWATGTLDQLRPAPTAAKAADDITTWMLYDGRGNIIATVDGQGYLTEYAYDLNGNKTSQTRYVTPALIAPGAITTTTKLTDLRNATMQADAQNQITTWTYTDLNQVATVTDYQNTQTQYTYDAVGNLLRTDKALGTADLVTNTVRYDKQGRVTGELTGEGSAALAALGGSPTQAQIDNIWTTYGTTYAYDMAGRRISATDADGHKTLFYYNSDGNLVYTINALGEVSENRYNALNQVTQTRNYGTRLSTIGLTGGLTSTALDNAIHALGNSAIDTGQAFTYNQQGLLETVSDLAGHQLNYYGYDAFSEKTLSSQSITASSVVQTQYFYDQRGELITTREDAGSSAFIDLHAGYDAFGRVTSTTDGNGKTSTTAYDRLGRVVQITDPLNFNRSTTYDAFSRVLTQTDALGNTTSYAYDKTARTLTVTTPEGIQTVTTTNRLGETVSIQDDDGNITQYQYDKNGNLTQTTDAAGVLNIVTQSSYDHANLLLSSTDANHTVTAYTYDAVNRVHTRTVDAVAGGLNLTTEYRYDAQGRMVWSKDANGIWTQTEFDTQGNVTAVTVDPKSVPDASGALISNATGLALRTEYTYDLRGKQLTVTHGAGSAAASTTRYEYDDLGRRTKSTIDPGGLNITHTYFYDNDSNVVASVDGNGNVTRYVYDSDDRQILEIDGTGSVRGNSYDADGKITGVTQYINVISFGGLSNSVTAAEINTRLTTAGMQAVLSSQIYDRDGRLEYTVDGAGDVVQYSYDNNGNVTERRAYAKRIDRSSWDGVSVPAVIANSDDQLTRTTYDALNRAHFTIDGVGAVMELRYDNNSNIVDRIAYAKKVAIPATISDSSIASAVSLVADSSRDAHIHRKYDADNRMIYSVDGTGAVTRQVFDANGNIIKLIAYANPIAVGASPDSVVASSNDRITRMTYDAADRLSFQVDAEGGITRKIYDEDSNVVATISYSTAWTSSADVSSATLAAQYDNSLKNPAADRVTRYVYDAANQLTFSIDAQGAITKIQYDGAGNAVKTTAFSNRMSLTAATSYRLSASNVTIVADATKDRVTRQAFDAWNHLVYSVDAEGGVARSTYDGLGRVTETVQYKQLITNNSALSIADIASALHPDATVDQKNTFQFDAASNLISSVDALGNSESYSYDGVGNKLSFVNKKGDVWLYEYDAAGRLTKETDPATQVTTVAANGDGLSVNESNSGLYNLVTLNAYDALGNLLSRTEASGRPEQRTTSYEYDALGRQVKIVFPAVGVYNAAADYPANGANGLASRTDSVTQPFSQITYDSLGNAVGNRDVAGNTSYKVYDHLGRLAYEIDAAGYVTGYTRNSFGEVTRIVRYAVDTSLAAASTPPSAAQVAGVLSTVDHSADRTIETTYDTLGRATLIEQPLEFVYDSSATTGNPYFWANQTTQNSYDTFGNLITSAVLRNPNEGAAGWDTTFNYYDQLNRLVATIDPMGYLTTQKFDAEGNLTEHAEYATALTSWNTTSYSADSPNADDRITDYAYDQENRKTSETRKSVLYSTGSNHNVTGDLSTHYAYDAVGNLLQTTDATGAVTRSFYDALGHVTAVVAPADDAGSAVSAFRRDAYGNVVAEISYAADAGSSQTDSTVPSLAVLANPDIRFDGTGNADHITLSLYDSHGHVLQTVDPTQVSTYFSYDAHGNVAKKWQAVTGNDGVTHTLFSIFQYDKLGQLTTSIQPASNTNLVDAPVITVIPATQHYDESHADIWSGPNTVNLAWSTLIDPTGGAVRVEVDYTTQDTTSVIGTDESGNLITVGTASFAASQTQDFSLGAALTGASVAWQDDYGLGSISQVHIWQQNAQGDWVLKWQGTPDQASARVETHAVSSSADLITTSVQYNAFGEIVSKGTGGDQQEYFTYDNAGRMWKTNSGDGVDKVTLFDLEGNATASITSDGSSNLRYLAANQIAAMTDVRRTDTRYDSLGQAVQTFEPTREVIQGGVQVKSVYADVNINTVTTPGGHDESGNFVWVGQNSISFTWDSLSALGSGDVKVIASYETKAQTIYAYDESGNLLQDESGNPIIVGTTSAVEKTLGQIFTSEQAANGVSFTWADENSNAGSISNVTHLQVFKKDATGTWQLVSDQTKFGATGSAVEIAAPADPTTKLSLYIRNVGSTDWGSPQPLVDFGDAYRFDASQYPAGQYEYQVTSTKSDGSATQIASGTLNFTSQPLNTISIPLEFGPVGSSVYAWQSPGANIEQTFRYREVGSTGPWTTVTVAARNGGYDGADLTGLAPGDYQYELLWTQADDIGPYAHTTGQIHITVPIADVWVAPINSPVISGVTLQNDFVGGVFTGYDESGQPTYIVGGVLKGYDEAGHPLYVAERTAFVLEWPNVAGTAHFQYRVAGGEWQTLPVEMCTENRSGVDVQDLPPGTYEYEIYITDAAGTQQSHATGTLVVNAQGPGSNQIVNVPVQVPVTVTPADPANYIVGYTGDGPTYGAPVVTGYDPSGNPIFGQGYGRSVSGYGESGEPEYGPVIAIPYVQYHTENQTQQVAVQVLVTVTPPDPNTYVVGWTGEGPTYGAPVVVGYDPQGNKIFGTGYTQDISNYDESGHAQYVGLAYAVPYTVWVPGMAWQLVSVDIPTQEPIVSGTDESGNIVYAHDESGQILYETVMVPSTEWEYLPTSTPETIYPDDPSNYIISAHSGDPIYGSPVVVGHGEDGLPTYGQGYANVNGQVVAVPYQTYETQYVSQTVQVQVGVTITPADPGNYIISPHSGVPIYGSPVVAGHTESGDPIYGQGYSEVNGQVVATPYISGYTTEYVPQTEWVPGTTPPPSMVDTTPPYTPGYIIPGTPSQYSAVASGSISGSPISEAAVSTFAGISKSLDGFDTTTRPVINRNFDRWGNVISASDPRSADWLTAYAYNDDNKLIKVVQPTAAGVTGAGPVTQYFYDAMGNSVATTDANQNTNAQVFDAEDRLIREVHADGGIVINHYDTFGNKTSTQDAMGNVTYYFYDKDNRLVETQFAPVNVYTVGMQTLTDIKHYDQAGRLLWETGTDGQTTHYEYDLQGNLVRTITPGGKVTSDAYDQQGHKIAEVDGNHIPQTWSYDYFGELLAHTDIGNAKYQYTYDNDRQLTAESNTRGQNIQYIYNQAGQVIQITDVTLDKVTTYSYDLLGNHTDEKTTQNGTVYQDNHLSYDALGRLYDINDDRVDVTMTYDNVGNRIHIQSHVIDSDDHSRDDSSWFAYDSMNRQILVDGVQNGDATNLGNLAAGRGHILQYDLNGNRIVDEHLGFHAVTSGHDLILQGYDESNNPIYYQENGEFVYTPVVYNSVSAIVQSDYTYDAMNRLSTTAQDGVVLDTRIYDADSRVRYDGSDGSFVNAYIAAFYDGGSGEGTSITTTDYDADGRVTHENIKAADGTLLNNVYFDSYDAEGNVLSYRVVSPGQENQDDTAAYTASVVRMDGYKQVGMQVTNWGLHSSSSGSSGNIYDVNGNLVGVRDSTQPASNRDFVDDASGITLFVNQGGNIQRQLVVGSNVLGRYGVAVVGTGDNSTPTFGQVSDFNFTYQAVDTVHPGGAPGTYVVRKGDTLQSIAQAVYGDAQLWYLIADENGLMSSNDLKAGLVIKIPTSVGTVHNNYQTFKPYDPNGILGSTMPNVPPPSGGGGDGCGVVGEVIMIIIAAVVTYLTYGATSEWLAGEVALEEGMTAAEVTATYGTAIAVASGAVAGAAGALAGQLTGVALGMQKSVNWGDVALGAIGGAIGGGLGTVDFGAGQIGNAVVRAAITSATTQGIGVATGLQEKFSWMSVAASAAAAGVSEGISEGLLGPTDSTGVRVPDTDLSKAFTGALGSGAKYVAAGLSSLGGDLTAAVVNHGKVDWAKVAGDVFGNVLVTALAANSSPAGGQQAKHDDAQKNSDGMAFWRDFQARKQADLLGPVSQTTTGRAPDAPAAPTVTVATDESIGKSHEEPVDPVVVLRNFGPYSPQPVSDEERMSYPDASGRVNANWTVKPGDTLWSISSDISGPGASVAQINETKNVLAAANTGIDDLNDLSVGQKINVVGKDIDSVTMRRAAAADSEIAVTKSEPQQPVIMLGSLNGNPLDGVGPSFNDVTGPFDVSQPISYAQPPSPASKGSGVNWLELGKSTIGMLGNGFTVATGVTIDAVGGAAIAAPDPTTLTKWGGAGAIIVGNGLVAKGAVGFSLNATNFMESLRGKPSGDNYLPGSALELVTQKLGGSESAVKLAQAADMSIDLVTGPLLGGMKLTTNSAAIAFDLTTPALLQAPRITTLATQATYKMPQIYELADTYGGLSGAASSVFTDYELGKNDFGWWGSKD